MELLKVLISNPLGGTQKMKRGTWIGVASEVEPVECVTNKANFQPWEVVRSAAPIKEPQDNVLPTVCSVQTTHEETHKQKLVQWVAEIGVNLPWQEIKQIVFFVVWLPWCVCTRERWTGRIQMNIDTGDATPRCQPVRRTLFAARQGLPHSFNKCRIKMWYIP